MPAKADGCGKDLQVFRVSLGTAGQELSGTLGSAVLNCYSISAGKDAAGQALSVAIGCCPECWRIVVSGGSKSTLESTPE